MANAKIFSSMALLRNSQASIVHKSGPVVRSLRSRREFHKLGPVFEEQRSFKGQLYESVAGRLERERAEQRRFARERGESSGGATAAKTFGEFNRCYSRGFS